MKILYDPEIFNLQVYGGISLYFTKLLSAFLKDKEIDFEIPLIYSDNSYLEDASFLKHIKLRNLDIPAKRQLAKFLTFLNRVSIINATKKQDFDIFHPTYFDKDFLKYLKNKPFVITIHDMIQEILPEYFIFDKKIDETVNIKRYFIEKASRIIAISENTKKDIMNLYSISEDKIDVIYHGLSLNVPEIIPEMDLPEKYILFVGQRAKYKNFKNFLLAIASILMENEQLYLFAAGGEDFNNEEKELIKSLNLADKLIYRPIKHDKMLAAFYKNAVCFVFPSLYEGFGFPVLEAFQSGCPVLCSSTSSFPEVAGDAAVYFDPYDLKSMNIAVKKIIQDENLRQDLIQKGKERLKNFSWAKTTELTKQTYKKAFSDG